MALSTIIKENCKECGKLAVEKSRVSFGSTKLITLECGHVSTEEVIKGADYASIISSDGRKLMPYQIEDLMKIESANARALLAWEQGLGKTVEVCSLLKLHPQELTPCIIVTKTSVKAQFHHEILRWCGTQGYLTQVILSGKEKAIPYAFQIYITTYEMLKKESIWEDVKNTIRFVVLDECQAIKDHLSDRAKAVQRICKNVEHILPMSGTPIKNNAGEYFTVLNLIQPKIFPQYVRFIENDCDAYNNGWGYKVGGLKNPAAFKEKTKDFIFRRTKEEVLPDLPKLFRKFTHADLDPKLNKAYAQGLKELEELYYKDMDSKERQNMLLAIMNKLRGITGIGKVEPAFEWVQEYLESSERKLVVFVHHHNVHTMMEAKLTNYCLENGLRPPLSLTASMSGEQRQELVQKFKNEPYRVAVMSSQAAGEGLNIQFCSDCLVLERQWNPANEEQMEARFHRFGQLNSVNANYMIATGTIDEYFTDLVEQKRAIVGSALDNKDFAWDQSSLLTELTNLLVTKGKKAWSLKV